MKISLEFNSTKELDEFIIERSQELCKLGKCENCRDCCEPEVTEKVEVEAKPKRKPRKKKEVEKVTDNTETTESPVVPEDNIPTETVDMEKELGENAEQSNQEEPETESTVETTTEDSTEEQDLTDKPLLAQAKAEKARREAEAKAQEEKEVLADIEPVGEEVIEPEKERVAVNIETMNDVVAFIRGHAGQINTDDMRKHMNDFAQWVTNQLPVLTQIKFEDELVAKINELLAQD